MAPTTNGMTLLDGDQVLRSSYDETSQSLKVKTNIAVTMDGSSEIVIDSSHDSIAIANAAGDALTINPDGSVDTNLQGLTDFQTSQYAVTSSAVQLTPSPLSNRSSVSLKCISSSNPVYVGNSSSVSTSTGYPLYGNEVLNMDLTATQQIWAIAASSGPVIAVLELA